MADKKNITIKDIAQATGLSPATVGRVFSSPEIVKQKTIDRVMNASNALGYQPSLAGKALRTGKSYEIAIMLPFDRQGSAATMGAAQYDLIAGFSSHCQQNGYNMKLLPFTSATEKEQVIESYLSKSKPDAFVITQLEEGDQRIQRLIDADIPTVTFGNSDSDTVSHSFDFDNYQFTYSAAAQLVNRGCERLTYLVSQDNYLHYIHQRNGFLDAQSQLGKQGRIEFNLVAVDVADNSSIAKDLRDIVAVSDAIITISPHLVHEIKKAAIAQGRTIGADLLVSSSSATPSILEMLDIPMTCYYQDFGLAGERLATLAVELANDPQASAKNRVQPYQVVTLGS
jgi:DNA-binding LacI/PurR family transcriptional regulator